MSAHWHIGMEVECIDAEGTPALKLGAIYTISGLHPTKYRRWRGVSRMATGILLKEVSTTIPGVDGFAEERFRPIQKRKTSIEIFNRILLNPSIKIREDA